MPGGVYHARRVYLIQGGVYIYIMAGGVCIIPGGVCIIPGRVCIMPGGVCIIS